MTISLLGIMMAIAVSGYTSWAKASNQSGRARELQSVIRARGCRDVGEARSMERGHEEVARAAGTVAREYAARAVRSVRGRSEPEEQEACCLIAEAGDGSAPVRIVAVGALLFAGDSRAVRAQPRAAVA